MYWFKFQIKFAEVMECIYYLTTVEACKLGIRNTYRLIT